MTGFQSHVGSYKKFKKWYLMPPCLTQYYKVRTKGNWSLQVTFDLGRQIHFLLIYIIMVLLFFWKEGLVLMLNGVWTSSVISCQSHYCKRTAEIRKKATKYWGDKRNFDCNYTRMLRTILTKPKRKHPTKQRLYGHLPSITKTIQVRQTRHVGHFWRSKDELRGDILQWTPSHGRANGRQPTNLYTKPLCWYRMWLERPLGSDGW